MKNEDLEIITGLFENFLPLAASPAWQISSCLRICAKIWNEPGSSWVRRIVFWCSDWDWTRIITWPVDCEWSWRFAEGVWELLLKTWKCKSNLACSQEPFCFIDVGVDYDSHGYWFGRIFRFFWWVSTPNTNKRGCSRLYCLGVPETQKPRSWEMSARSYALCPNFPSMMGAWNRLFECQCFYAAR